MNKEKIQSIISKGEGISIEFKTANKKLPENLFETICAFLNRNGGKIILGVNDKGDVFGVDKNKQTETSLE